MDDIKEKRHSAELQEALTPEQLAAREAEAALNKTIERLWEMFNAGAAVCTDSRQVTPGCIFFALKGETFDGNKFAISALEKGAAVAVVDSKDIFGESACSLKNFEDSAVCGGTPDGTGAGKILLVENTLVILQQLARFNRLKYRIPVIGLTGTNGKTTTKELISAVLSTELNVVATEGNLNNHIGVPYTLLRINSSTQAAVVEMGASAPGEIKTLVELVCPSFGLITNVGTAHLQGFGSREAIIATKGELYDNLVAHHKIAFLNVDNPLLVEMAHKRDLKIIPYGVKNNCARILHKDGNPYLRMTVPSPDMKSRAKRYRIETHLIGDYNADNVMAALTVGTYFGIPGRKAVKAISKYTPSNNRSQLKVTGNNTLIIDAYNANPSSMGASLRNFEKLQFENRMLLLGDMRELGTESVAEHVNILRQACAMDVMEIYLVGAEFAKAADVLYSGTDSVTANLDCGESSASGASISLFADVQELAAHLKEKPLSGRTILIKGSHGIHLETLVELL